MNEPGVLIFSTCRTWCLAFPTSLAAGPMAGPMGFAAQEALDGGFVSVHGRP